MAAREICRFLLTPLFAGLIAGSLLAGCGPGSGQGLDADGNSLTASPPPSSPPAGGGGGGASGNANATLAWVQTNVFGGVCSQCHTGVGAPLGIDWSSTTHTCSNVGRASSEMSSLMEINRGNPDGSYMIWKISGAGPNGETIQGGRMPLNNPVLTADTIKNMHDWVADGAPGC